MENAKNDKKRKFNVTGIENFDVIPLQKGKEYIILEVSKDGFKWKAKDSRGRVGWIPAHYCRALGILLSHMLYNFEFIYLFIYFFRS